MAEEVIKIEQLSHFKDKLLEKCDETYQGKLTAGENITISEDNVISATGGGSGSVSTDDTLNGDGTESNPLGVDIDKISDELHYPTETSNFVADEPLRMYADDEGTVHITSEGGMSTVHTAEPIIGDGSEENPVTANTLDVDYQQITHDDSLVHVSNNAQYALGVNLPVIKQAIFGENTFVTEKTLLVAGNLTSGSTHNDERTISKPGYYPVSFNFYANDRQFIIYATSIEKNIGSLYVKSICTNKYSSTLLATYGICITWMKVQ